MIAGIDLGGTQVRFAVARSDGRITGQEKARTAVLGSPHGLAEWAAQAAERLGARRRLKSVAIGAPGPIDHRRGVLVNPPNLPGWRNVNLTELLAGALGCPVYLENDALSGSSTQFLELLSSPVAHTVVKDWFGAARGGQA